MWLFLGLAFSNVVILSVLNNGVEKNEANLTILLSVDATGLKQKIDTLAQLKVKGLVVGPIHKAPADNEMELDLDTVSVAGDLTQFKALIDVAHKKSEWHVRLSQYIPV